MILRQITLQHFRSYPKANFTFDPHLTIIVGPNATGKTNLIEAISILAAGKSFRTSKEKQLISFEQTVARISGQLDDEGTTESLEVVVALNPQGLLQKRYLINGVFKRRASLSGLMPIVLFTPLDLDIVSGQPGTKRKFLDEVLEQTDPQYASALYLYTKALRQRNALLEVVQQTGRRDEDRFAYWDNLLITNGQIVTEKREAFIATINQFEKKLFQFELMYDKSLMSRERLLQYKDAEVGAGVTLVGPQRDDVNIQSLHPISKELEDVKYFCSRGQQRLVTLELKNAQISYLQEQLHVQPLLVLDDIFSELDQTHIEHVLHMTNHYQTVMTTTHEEFVASKTNGQAHVIQLEKENG